MTPTRSKKGHTLIIPKRHFVDIWDIEPAVLVKVVTVAKRAAQRMATILNSDGISTPSARAASLLVKKSITSICI